MNAKLQLLKLKAFVVLSSLNVIFTFFHLISRRVSCTSLTEQRTRVMMTTSKESLSNWLKFSP